MPKESVYKSADGTPFPVTWPEEGMAAHGWRWDQIHHQTPLTPLAREIWLAKSDGMRASSMASGRYANGEFVEANGYLFRRPIPPAPGELAQLEGTAKRDEAQRLGQLVELWETRYRPEVEALIRSLTTWAAPRDSLADLVGRIDELPVISYRLGELHALVMGLTGTAVQQFRDFCDAELSELGPEFVFEAISGLPNKSLESAEALWQLSRAALEQPSVAALLRESTPAEFLAGLPEVEGGEDFLERLDSFLEEYGQRNESFTELAFPTWQEDPRFVVFTLKSYLGAPADRSPAAMHDVTARRRIERTEQARNLLADDSKFAVFAEAQRVAQQRTLLVEDHNFYIDQRGHSSQRLPCLALGERLASQRTIERAEDVFYLNLAEITAAGTRRETRYQDLVEERRTERERWLRRLPPNVIGDGEVRLPPQAAEFLGPTEAEPSGPGEIKGVAGSPGTARGVARVVRTLDEVEKLEPGDVLVAYATAPPWTPLFSVASAIVTDAGGPTAHAAIVAREFGIPAVVGTKAATARLEDGMVVTVDGTEGVVRIER